MALSYGGVRIAMVGVTGAGKSALGNTIVQQKKFTSKCSNDSVTSKCEVAEVYGLFGEEKIVLVDTPGFQDTRRNTEDIKKEVVKCIMLLEPGPHAFLIVLSPHRFNADDKKCLKEMQGLFGSDDFFNHSIVVFTRKTEIFHDGDYKDLQAFVREGVVPDVQQVIHKCGNRVMAVENVHADKKKEATAVYDEVCKMIRRNRSAYYSNDVFQLSNKLREGERSHKRVQQELDALVARSKRSFCTIL